MAEDWITTAEAAKISGYHQEHLRRLLKQNKIEGRKFGIVWQVSQRSLQKYLDRMAKLGKRRGPKANL
jgi:excisionase family DNA binding protein